MKERIYVCHTFYHVYITLLKELKIRAEAGAAWTPGATLVLSKLSNRFGDLKTRAEAAGLFEEVLEYDEKREDFFPELDRFRHDTGNGWKNLIQRVRLTGRFAKLQEAFVPCDFRSYKEIYVYCDTDPIGPYLARHRIRFHALEDGLNCVANYDAAHYDNRGHYKLKEFLSEHLNLIYVQYGHNKYCVDMEVNDKSIIKYPFSKQIEVPRAPLRDRLTEADKELILNVFLENREALVSQVAKAHEAGDGILILTDPLCTLDIRERIFRDIIGMYREEGTLFLKPHPRDYLDYPALFPDIPQIAGSVPMELIGFIPGAHFRKVVGVLTEMSDFPYADEAVRLGPDFMDKYEDPAVHRQNEQI